MKTMTEKRIAAFLSWKETLASHRSRALNPFHRSRLVHEIERYYPGETRDAGEIEESDNNTESDDWSEIESAPISNARLHEIMDYLKLKDESPQ